MAASKPLKYDDLYEICKDRDSIYCYLRQKKLLGDFSGPCDSCDCGRITLKKDKSYSKDKLVWRCTNKNCYRKFSIRHNSWFEHSHLSLSSILKLTYYWVYKLPLTFIKLQLDIGSNSTGVDWYNFCREVCLQIIIQDSKKVGGPGKTVEIDESKFGKRKYHRGKRVEGAWVFGGIERESRESFFEVVADRSAETLIPIIQKYIEPGTTIISDCWKAYSSLSTIGYTHLTVNHSKEFKNKETGAHTNSIESTWHALKLSLPRSGTQKQLYNSYFEEYVIRKRYLETAEDKFTQYVNLIARVYKCNKRQKSEEPVQRQPLGTIQPVQSNPLLPVHTQTLQQHQALLDHSYSEFDNSMDLFDD